jgi:hypothetical protein
MRSKDHREELDRLASAMVDDLLATPDEQLLAELGEADVEAILAAGRDILAGTRRKAGKATLAHARKHIAREAAKPRGNRLRLAPDVARRRLSGIVANASADSRITLAARAGKGVPDEDLDGLVEDADDLGFDIDADPEKKS